MAIVTVGIDLAKNVFAVHGVDATGKATLIRPSVPRAKLGELIATLPPCLIGMEACSGAHHWARLFATHGHTVRLMAPKFVAPYRLSGKRGKNDAADALAICEATRHRAIERQGFQIPWPPQLDQPDRYLLRAKWPARPDREVVQRQTAATTRHRRAVRRSLSFEVRRTWGFGYTV